MHGPLQSLIDHTCLQCMPSTDIGTDLKFRGEKLMKFRFAAAASAFFGSSPIAFAQEQGGAGGGLMAQLIFFVPLILIFYFLLIRPANQRQKKHKAMIEAVVRGDTVITSGGLIGKVAKVTDQEISVDLAEGLRVRVVRSMIADVRGKNEPAPANDSKSS
ncbi:MAG: preprotein translocase subunit YajC [Henriciella sp.]|uniref:preprotein translocase subunit YajC n=1 Tax=Henriciella sp. TaxID=1968823 RepID=UPI0032EBE7AE